MYIPKLNKILLANPRKHLQRATIHHYKGKTNLENKSLASADRSNKATLLLTALCSIFKSSAKDLSPPKSNIIFRRLKAKRFRLP